MAGLDSIKKYNGENGSSVSSGADTAQVQIKPGKSSFLAGNVAADPEQLSGILEGMQKIVDERDNPYAKFQEGLRQMVASAHGPQALASYQQVADTREKQLMDYRTQMAEVRAAQSQAANDAARVAAIKGGGAGGTSTIPGVGAVSNDIINDPNIKPLLDAARNPTEYLAIYNKANQDAYTARLKGRNEAAARTQQKFFVGNEIRNLTPNEYDDLKAAGYNPTPVNVPTTGATTQPTTGAQIQSTGGGYHGVAADVNNPTGIKADGGFKTYKTPEHGVADTQNLIGTYLSGQGPMTNVKRTPENFNGMWIAGDASKGADPSLKMHLDLIKTELKNAGIELDANGEIPNTPAANAAIARSKIKGEAGPKNAEKFLPHVSENFGAGIKPVTGNLPPHPDTLRIGAAQPSATQPSATQPSATQNLPFPNPKNIEQAEANQKFIADMAAAQPAGAKKEAEQIGEDAGKHYTSMIDMSKKANEAIQDLNLINNLATNKQHIFGLGINNPVIGGLGNVLHLTDKDKAEEFTANRLLNPDDRSDWGLTQSAAGRVGVAYVANAMKGARIGVGLERLGIGVKGVGPERTAQENRVNSDVLRESFQFAKDVSSYYNDTWSKQHPGESFAKFEASPEYRKMDDAVLDKMANKYPQYFKKTDQAPDSIQERANKAFGKHEPDQYDYRVNDKGEVQRKRKAQ